jgi:hypothetical protein
MAPTADGAYALVGAFLCFPMRWRLAEKLGRPLRAIHGPVPGFAERLGSPADRFFATIDAARPVWRANWSLTDDPALFQPHGRGKPISVTAADAGERLFLRVERQTLRRLPASGQVLFTIRSFVKRLDEALERADQARAMAARVREMPEAVARYKNILGIREPLLAWLDAKAARAPQHAAA